MVNSNLKRYSFRVNADARLSEKIKFSQSLSFARTINRSGAHQRRGGRQPYGPSAKKYTLLRPPFPYSTKTGNMWITGTTRQKLKAR